MLQISAHPPVWAQSNVYRPSALFRETTVYAKVIKLFFLDSFSMLYCLQSSPQIKGRNLRMLSTKNFIGSLNNSWNISSMGGFDSSASVPTSLVPMQALLHDHQILATRLGLSWEWSCLIDFWVLQCCVKTISVTSLHGSISGRSHALLRFCLCSSESLVNLS